VQVSKQSLDQEKEQSKLKEEAAKNRTEANYENIVATLREQLQMRERELNYHHATRRSQIATQRREQQLMGVAFHELALRFFNEKASKEKVTYQFEAMLSKVQKLKADRGGVSVMVGCLRVDSAVISISHVMHLAYNTFHKVPFHLHFAFHNGHTFFGQKSVF